MKKILMIVAVGLMSLPTFAQTADNSDVLRRADVMPVFQDCEDERFAEHPYRCTIMQLMAHFDDAQFSLNIIVFSIHNQVNDAIG